MAWQTEKGKWVYADSNVRSQTGDEADSSTDGQDGTITATAVAKPKRSKSSSATASWSATYTGKRTWKAAGPNDPPTEETMPFSVNYTLPNWMVAVVAVEGETATASAFGSIALQINGINKDVQTVIQRTLGAPPSETLPKTHATQAVSIDLAPYKHTADLTYGVTITVSASASRTGESSSGNSIANISCTVNDPP